MDTAAVTATTQPSLENLPIVDFSLLITAGDTNFSAGHLAPLISLGSLSAAMLFASLRLVIPKMARMVGLSMIFVSERVSFRYYLIS